MRPDERQPCPAKVRPAEERDIDALLPVEQQCFDVYYYGRYKLDRHDFHGYLEDTASIFLVAACDAQVVGYVLGPAECRRARRTAHIDSIAVLPQAQHTGIGAQLLQSFIEHARQRGCSRVTLEAAIANKTGLAFFAKHGFREIRKLPHYYGRNLPGLLLAADI